MGNNIYIHNEAKKGFKNWTKAGLEFLAKNHKDYQLWKQ